MTGEMDGLSRIGKFDTGLVEAVEDGCVHLIGKLHVIPIGRWVVPVDGE